MPRHEARRTVAHAHLRVSGGHAQREERTVRAEHGQLAAGGVPADHPPSWTIESTTHEGAAAATSSATALVVSAYFEIDASPPGSSPARSLRIQAVAR